MQNFNLKKKCFDILMKFDLICIIIIIVIDRFKILHEK